MSELSDTMDYTGKRIILLPSAPFGIPEVLADDEAGTWSIRIPGFPTPKVYRCSDVVGCEVKELGHVATTEELPADLAGAQLVSEILKNPGKVAKRNRMKSGNFCDGVYLKVCLASTDEPVYITMWAHELKRGTKAHKQVIESAETVKRSFDEMIEGA